MEVDDAFVPPAWQDSEMPPAGAWGGPFWEFTFTSDDTLEEEICKQVNLSAASDGTSCPCDDRMRCTLDFRLHVYSAPMTTPRQIFQARWNIAVSELGWTPCGEVCLPFLTA